MTVVSDTSPISYLVLIRREEVIDGLYGEVLVPEAVHRELVHPRGPDAVRERISNSPSWMKVKAASSGEEGFLLPEAKQGDLKDLDPGEREAILLAARCLSASLKERHRPCAADFPFSAPPEHFITCSQAY